MVISRASSGKLTKLKKKFREQGMSPSQALEKALAEQEKEEEKKRRGKTK